MSRVGGGAIGPVRRAVWKLPTDLGVVLALVAIADTSLFLPRSTVGPVGVLFGLALVVFLPGYAVVAALFPAKGTHEVPDVSKRASGQSSDGIEVVERIGFAFGLSIVIVSAVGLALNGTPWGLRRVPIVISLSGVTVVATAVAVYRRLALPKRDRFDVDIRRRFWRFQSEIFDQRSWLDTVLSVVLLTSVVLAVGSIAYIGTVPTTGEQNTGFYLLSEDEEGDFVMGNYPTEFETSEPRSVILQVRNEEARSVSYTVVVLQQAVGSRNNSTVATEERELDRIRTGSVANDRTWTQEYGVTPTMAGDRMRFAFLLYRGASPSDPSIDTAYRTVQLRGNVSS